MKSFRSRLIAMIGNVLGHYDSMLFALLIPFLSPWFFGKQESLTALILTYLLLPLGMITRPLGAIFFGWMGDRFGRDRALFYALFGAALTMVGTGFLPTYREIGFLAPCLLALTRIIQSFCLAGAKIGAAIFVLEHTQIPKRNLVSSFYEASTMIGIVIASALVTFWGQQGWLEQGWRTLFFIGGGTGIAGIFLRLHAKDEREFTTAVEIKRPSLLQILKQHKVILFYLVLSAGFYYAIYEFVFTFMNGYIPIVTSLTKEEVLKINTWLLAGDLLLLPCFGYLAGRFSREKLIFLAVVCATVSVIPLFSCLRGASLSLVIFIRLIIMIFGVAFVASYRAFAMQQVPPQHRYVILSLGSALGSQFIGAPTSAGCLWLYQTTGYVMAPAVYLFGVGLLASYAIWRLLNLSRLKTKDSGFNALLE